MTSKAGHTAGPAEYDSESGDVVMADEVGARIASVDIENCANADQADADGLLIAEAFTVTHETGLTPRQLAERCEKLEAALRPFAEACKAAAWPTFESDNCQINASFGLNVGQLRAARAAISKTGGAA